MSTNAFVSQPNSQKIGGFLPFVKGSCAGLIATRCSTPTGMGLKSTIQPDGKR
jgi:hypothetical protein